MAHGDCGLSVQAETRQNAQGIAGAFRKIDRNEQMPIKARGNAARHQERLAARTDRSLGRRADNTSRNAW